jgi:hypothetical protein
MNAKQILSIMSVLWTFFVTAPLWFVLQYAILGGLGDAVSSKVWALFIVYVPACLAGVVLIGITRVVLDGDDKKGTR